MKKSILILALLGALAAGGLGAKWAGDYGALTEDQKMTAQLTGQGERLTRMATASLILLAGFFAGLAGAYLVRKESFLIAGGLMLGAGVLPIFYASETIIFTALLIAAGVTALVAHAKAGKSVPE